MLVYWILLAFASTFVLVRGTGAAHKITGQTSSLAMIVFALYYIAIGALRFETGGDWVAYEWKYTQISYGSLAFALDYTDPLFGLLNWISHKLGTGIYLVNGIVCAIIVAGVLRVSRLTRDPWLAIMISVPYILIVIGMGFVRQAAAIGLILLALQTLERERKLRSVFYLALAAGFHSTSIVVFPLFLAAVSRRFLTYAAIVIGLSGYTYYSLFEPKLDAFQTGYLEAGYESSGAFVRLMMSFVPAVVLLARWRNFRLPGPSRPVWFLFALGAIGLFGAYFISPSSTAVDRVGLYFSVVQIAVFGELLNLVNFKQRDTLYLRVSAIALAITIQVVWLFFAVHAGDWVPYNSILEFA